MHTRTTYQSLRHQYTLFGTFPLSGATMGCLFFRKSGYEAFHANDCFHLDSIYGLKVGNCLQCLGSAPEHTLELKFDALRSAGIRFVEFSFADYFNWVRVREPDIPDGIDPEAFGDEEPKAGDDDVWTKLQQYAPEIKSLAQASGIELCTLQCIGKIEGWGPATRREVLGLQKFRNWIRLCKELGIGILQMGVNDDYDAVGDREKVIADMSALAAEAADMEIKIAYESWNFAPKRNAWEDTWDIVRQDHPNLGLCIDTAQCALAPEYGFDPCTGNGFTEMAVQAMLERLRRVPPEKIFFVEISDVLAPDPPLLSGSRFDEWHHAQGRGFRPGLTWCRCARVLPGIGAGTGKLVKGSEGIGAGRTMEVVRAVLDTGFRGPFFFECFEALEQEQPDLGIPSELVLAGLQSWKLLHSSLLNQS